MVTEEIALTKEFKQTEVGLIPGDWGVKVIGEFAVVGSGGTPDRKKDSYWNGTIPWITTSQIDSGIIDKAEEFITESGLTNSSAKLFPKGTLLMAMYGQGKTRGKVGVLNIEAATNQACAAIRLNNKVDSNYILHNLSHRYEEIRGLSNTGNQENLNGFIIKNIPVPLPPTLAEQRAIATALSDVDALIISLDALIAKKREIKQGTMQQLLTGTKRLPGFSEEWKMKTLGEVLKSHRLGGNYKNSEVVTDWPLIKMGNIYRSNINLNKVEYITFESIIDQKDKLQFGDVLFNTRNTLDLVGKVAIWRNELVKACYNSNIMRLEFKLTEVASNFFMNYTLNTRKSVARLKEMATGTTSVAAIYTKDLLHFELLMPPLDEQRAIAQVLSDMDAELDALMQKRAKYQTVKQGMMQQLLTGRIRLV